MNGPTRTGWSSRLLVTGSAATLAVLALATAPPQAQARVWVSVGVPFPGYYYGPGPYYGYPSPSYYAPPPGYYPPPSGYYAPPQGAYPAPPGPAPSAYTPPATGAAPSATTAPAAPGMGGITYTNKPAFTNAAGQTCREYKTTNAAAGRSVDVYGTACKTADGQWRVVN